MKLWAFLGALNGAIAVAAGAFGAHWLKSRLSADMLAIFETGARYQMYHAFGLIAVAWLASTRAPLADSAGWCMLAGIVLFSGSLYALVLSGARAWGAVTPFGGVAFLAAWTLLALASLRGL